MSAVGIDVGKRSHEAGFLNGSGEPIGRSLRFANTASGVQALHERLQALPEAPTIALEASGQYWLGLQRRLAPAGYATHVINPLQARASRCRRRLCRGVGVSVCRGAGRLTA
jgi:transposase